MSEILRSNKYTLKRLWRHLTKPNLFRRLSAGYVAGMSVCLFANKVKRFPARFFSTSFWFQEVASM